MKIPSLSLGWTLKSNTLKAMVEYHHPVNRDGTVRVDPAPPPFLQTCSEVGEERDEFSPIEISLPEEVLRFFFFFFFFFFKLYVQYIQICTSIYICTDLL